MKINLMEPVSSVKRYFRWWVGGIILFHVLLVGAAGFLFWEQSTQIEKLEKQKKLLEPVEKETKKKVEQEQKFRKQHGSVLNYKETVEKLQSENIEWDLALQAIGQALTPEAKTFNLKAKGNELSGMVVFASEHNMSIFETKMKANKLIKQFMIEGVGKASAIKEVQIKPDNATVVRFRFQFQPPKIEKSNESKGNNTKNENNSQQKGGSS
ncbi:hypothetical protein [Thermoflavimicrobium daqui]|uniref:Fimbrial assembly protein (PilN) n=1 Tax=Thermoflavimicrobium daqui TaxID=2137476 RepID=A0A364K8P1_9BACL|nr:hypothetical protein [Thermoflavimicrobium daqui]RAL26654.1 hypothetical protein DL897_00980 [Thermoflavimicrobium daqui]